jgi:hypothetical protein
MVQEHPAIVPVVMLGLAQAASMTRCAPPC